MIRNGLKYTAVTALLVLGGFFSPQDMGLSLALGVAGALLFSHWFELRGPQ